VRFGFVQYPSRLLFEQALRFPTGEALVKHIHRQTQLLAQARGEARGFLGHFATRAVEPKRQADDDLTDTMFAGKFAQAPHIFIAIDAIEREEGAGHSGVLIRDGEPDASAAVVDAQNGARRTSGCAHRYIWWHLSRYGFRPLVPFCQASQ
jgi:hypothetical protein